MKAKQITSWYADEINDAKTISHNFFLTGKTIAWLKSKKENEKNLLSKYLSSLKEEHGYENLTLTNSDGKFLVSAKNGKEIPDKTLFPYIKRAALTKATLSTDLFFCPSHNKIHMNFISPILDSDSSTVAVIIFQIDPFSFLFPALESWTTASKTSESLLLRKENESVLFLNELRHKKNSALKLRISMDREEVAAIKAVKGFKGIFDGKDYRGEDVLAYLSPLNVLDWYMVTKIDKDELFENLFYKSRVIILFTGLSILFLIAVLAFIYNYSEKKTYEALWKVQQEFKTTLYSIGDAVITTDDKGNVQYLNSVAENLTGWTESEASGRPLEEVFKIINEGTRKTVESPVTRVLKEGIIVGLANHTLLISKDGSEFPIADSGAPIRNENGEMIGVVLVFRDQTHEKEKQKAVEESEAKYRSLFLSTNDGICLHEIIRDSSGKAVNYLILDANKKYEEIIGITADKIIGRRATEVYYSETAPYLEIYAEVAESGRPVLFETHYEPMQKHFLISVYSPGKGKFATVFQDITLRKKNEIELREREAFLRTTLYSIGDGIITTDKNGNVTRLNYVAENLTGWKEEEAYGKPLKEVFNIINEETREVVENPVHRVLKEGVVVGLANHTLLISKNGTEFPIADSGSPIKNEDDEIIGVVLVFRDQTDEKS